MANTFTFNTDANGATDFQFNNEFLRSITTGDRIDQIGPNTLRVQGHNGAYDFKDIDVSVDTVIITGGATYGPGSNAVTVFRALKPFFKKATANGGNGGSNINSLDNVPDSTSRFALTAAQRTFLNNLMSVDNP